MSTKACTKRTVAGSGSDADRDREIPTEPSIRSLVRQVLAMPFNYQLLLHLSTEANAKAVRMTALRRIMARRKAYIRRLNQYGWRAHYRALLGDGDPFVRAKAVSLSDEPRLWVHAVRTDHFNLVRIRAVQRISDAHVLQEVCANDPDSRVRDAARVRLFALEFPDSTL